MSRMKKHVSSLLALLLALLLWGCSTQPAPTVSQSEEAVVQTATEATAEEATATEAAAAEENDSSTITLENLPAYSGSPCVELCGNVPTFTEEEFTTTSFECYSELDELGRCGVAFACLGQDLMPTEARESISEIKPTGWHSVQYPGLVDEDYLYNRCHLIAFMLAGENANALNLITGTRYMNTEGMLPFETAVCTYVKETGNHVLYRITPIFEGENLVASGVVMEAYSVEDAGEGIQFYVYCYNVQPGICIDYATGESWEEDESPATYILNTNTMKFHAPTCSAAESISPANRQTCTTTRQELIAQGYTVCGRCNGQD